ncbi:MAG: hypothetical protein Q4B68_01885 [Bacteroidales bacterium]|nr:hypothetical protein [Bacteroidales bacterium]
MANYCFTTYAIEGKKEVLQKVADAINSGDGYMCTAFKTLGLEFDEERWPRRAEWERGAKVEERGDVSVLFFTQAYPWEDALVIDEVLEELGEPNARIYSLAQRFEDEIHTTNDHEGKYFPERHLVFTAHDDDWVYFKTLEEAIAHIRKSYPALPAEITDIEEMDKFCTSNGEGFSYYEIFE